MSLPLHSISVEAGQSEMTVRGPVTAAAQALLARVSAPQNLLAIKKPGDEGRLAPAARKARVLQNTIKLSQTNCSHNHVQSFRDVSPNREK